MIRVVTNKKKLRCRLVNINMLYRFVTNFMKKNHAGNILFYFGKYCGKVKWVIVV